MSYFCQATSSADTIGQLCHLSDIKTCSTIIIVQTQTINSKLTISYGSLTVGSLRNIRRSSCKYTAIKNKYKLWNLLNGTLQHNYLTLFLR